MSEALREKVDKVGGIGALEGEATQRLTLLDLERTGEEPAIVDVPGRYNHPFRSRETDCRSIMPDTRGPSLWRYEVENGGAIQRDQYRRDLLLTRLGTGERVGVRVEP